MVDEILLYSLLCCIFHYCPVDENQNFEKGLFWCFLFETFFQNIITELQFDRKIGTCQKMAKFYNFLLQKLPFEISSTYSITNTKHQRHVWQLKYCTRGSNLASLVASPLVILPDLVATRAVFCTTKRLRRLVFIYYVRNYYVRPSELLV